MSNLFVRFSSRAGLWCAHFTLFVCLLAFPPRSEAIESAPLSLSDAFKRVLTQSPDLEVFRWRNQVIEGEKQTAALSPAFEASLDLENALGSGDFSSARNAELTLSLSSVIELGGKKEARIGLADARHALVAVKREISALSLLSETTQHFVVVMALQEKQKVMAQALKLSEQSLQLVSQRVSRGAAPKAERLRASAALRQATIALEALESNLASEKYALSALWRSNKPDFDRVAGNLYAFENADSFDLLFQRAIKSPVFERFATEARVRQARLEMASTQSRADLGWSIGVRRFQTSKDSALLAGLSVPLFSKSRNQGALTSIDAEAQMLQAEKDVALRKVRVQLHEAWQTYRQNVQSARQMQTEVIPALEAALEQTRQAYQRGLYSYVDWVSAQHELLQAKLTTIDAASTALLNQALIEQLTAESLSAPAQR